MNRRAYRTRSRNRSLPSASYIGFRFLAPKRRREERRDGGCASCAARPPSPGWSQLVRAAPALRGLGPSLVPVGCVSTRRPIFTICLLFSRANCAATLSPSPFFGHIMVRSPVAGAPDGKVSSRSRRAISRAISGRSSRLKGRSSEAQRLDPRGRSCQAQPKQRAVTSPGKLVSRRFLKGRTLIEFAQSTLQLDLLRS